MSEGDEVVPAEEPGERKPLDLLVWDAPNIDMTLANVIGARPSASSRPRFDAVAKWLLAAKAPTEMAAPRRASCGRSKKTLIGLTYSIKNLFMYNHILCEF